MTAVFTKGAGAQGTRDQRSASSETRQRLSEAWVLPDADASSFSVQSPSQPETKVPRSPSKGTERGEQVEEPDVVLRELIRGSARKNRSKIKMLQQWECIVDSIQDGCVLCEMHDLTDASKPAEVAEIYLEEFNEYDRPLLQEGAVFYWSIGRETKPKGQVWRYSNFRMRRIPPLSSLQEAQLDKEAEEISAVLLGFGPTGAAQAE